MIVNLYILFVIVIFPHVKVISKLRFSYFCFSRPYLAELIQLDRLEKFAFRKQGLQTSYRLWIGIQRFLWSNIRVIHMRCTIKRVESTASSFRQDPLTSNSKSESTQPPKQTPDGSGNKCTCGSVRIVMKSVIQRKKVYQKHSNRLHIIHFPRVTGLLHPAHYDSKLSRR